jgi:hypothetical protein
MAVVINGNGTVTGLAVGGLPDGIVDAGTLATDSVDSAELIDGSIDTSHIAADAVTVDKVGSFAYENDTPAFITNTLASGAIMENGSNANGKYTKFSDGTLICTLVQYDVTTTSSMSDMYGTSSGTSYRTGVSKTFPHAFIATPSVVTSGEGRLSVTEHAGTSTTGVTLYTYTQNSTYTVSINATAIGRWK